MDKALFTSEKTDWRTPPELFARLYAIHHFTLDAAASDQNHLCEKYFTEENSGLTNSWQGETVFCNPPYGRTVGEWVRKAYIEYGSLKCKIVMLLPARTDTRWFHDYIYRCAKIEFIKGRLKFSGSKNSAPFPSMIVIFGG